MAVNAAACCTVKCIWRGQVAWWSIVGFPVGLSSELLAPEDGAVGSAKSGDSDAAMTVVENVRPVPRRVHPRADRLAAVRLAHCDVFGNWAGGVYKALETGHPTAMFAGRFH